MIWVEYDGVPEIYTVKPLKDIVRFFDFSKMILEPFLQARPRAMVSFAGITVRFLATSCRVFYQKL